jgi:hypothetical protein
VCARACGVKGEECKLTWRRVSEHSASSRQRGGKQCKESKGVELKLPENGASAGRENEAKERASRARRAEQERQ